MNDSYPTEQQTKTIKRQEGWSAKGEWYQHFQEIHYWLKSYSGTPETPNNYWINSSWSEGEKKISRKPNFEDETEISRVRSLLVSASLEKKNFNIQFKKFGSRVIQAMKQKSFIATCVFNAFFGFTAITFNIVTILALRKPLTISRAVKTLLLSQAVSDLGVELLVQPLYVAYLVMLIQENTQTRTFDIIKNLYQKK